MNTTTMTAQRQQFRKYTISLPESIGEEVDQVIASEGRSRSEVIREALRMYLAARKNSPLFDFDREVGAVAKS